MSKIPDVTIRISGLHGAAIAELAKQTGLKKIDVSKVLMQYAIKNMTAPEVIEAFAAERRAQLEGNGGAK